MITAGQWDATRSLIERETLLRQELPSRRLAILFAAACCRSLTFMNRVSWNDALVAVERAADKKESRYSLFWRTVLDDVLRDQAAHNSAFNDLLGTSHIHYAQQHAWRAMEVALGLTWHGAIQAAHYAVSAHIHHCYHTFAKNPPSWTEADARVKEISVWQCQVIQSFSATPLPAHCRNPVAVEMARACYDTPDETVFGMLCDLLEERGADVQAYRPLPLYKGNFVLDWLLGRRVEKPRL